MAGEEQVFMDGPHTEASRRFRLPRSRRLTCDVLHFHGKMPMCPHDRLVDLGRLNQLRKRVSQRISMAALFIKAYGLMAVEFPAFRQRYSSFPIANVRQHHATVLMLAVAREHQGEPWLFWGRFMQPESASLDEIQRLLNRYQTGDVELVFRRQLNLSQLPTFFRRAIWWWNINIAGRSGAKRVGTAFLTTLSGRGAEIRNPPSFQTGCFSYGPMDKEGISRVTLSYDHRLMDGATVAAALECLDSKLNDVVAGELRTLAGMEIAAA